jgi:hypothetical protein
MASMKKLPVLVLGLLIVAPLGCKKDVGAPKPTLREGEVIMMPGQMPGKMPPQVRKAIEGKVQQPGEGPPIPPGDPGQKQK